MNPDRMRPADDAVLPAIANARGQRVERDPTKSPGTTEEAEPDTAFRSDEAVRRPDRDRQRRDRDVTPPPSEPKTRDDVRGLPGFVSEIVPQEALDALDRAESAGLDETESTARPERTPASQAEDAIARSRVREGRVEEREEERMARRAQVQRRQDAERRERETERADTDEDRRPFSDKITDPEGDLPLTATPDFESRNADVSFSPLDIIRRIGGFLS